MEKDNNRTSENEHTTEFSSQSSSASKIGRKGDPRMHKAVAARLANPSLTLSEALRLGGFEYPTDDDSNTVDAENVTLAQRKNQLSRRIRMTRQQQEQEKMQQYIIPTRESNACVPLNMANHYHLQLQRLIMGGQSLRNSNDSCLVNRPITNTSYELQPGREQLSHPSFQWNIAPFDSSNSTSEIKTPQQQYNLDSWNVVNQEASPSIQSTWQLSQGNQTNLFASNKPTETAQNSRLDNFHSLNGIVSASSSFPEYDTLVKQALCSNLSTGGQETNSSNAVTEGSANKRAFEDFVSHPSYHQLPGAVNSFAASESNGSLHMRAGLHLDGQAFVFDNSPSKKPLVDPKQRQDNALKLFQQEIKALYKKCLLESGYAPATVEGEDSSPEYRQFVLAAWQEQGHYAQKLIAGNQQTSKTDQLPGVDTIALTKNFDFAKASNNQSVPTLPENHALFVSQQGPPVPVSINGTNIQIFPDDQTATMNEKIIHHEHHIPNGSTTSNHTSSVSGSAQSSIFETNGMIMTDKQHAFSLDTSRPELKLASTNCVQDLAFHENEWVDNDFNEDEGEAIMRVFEGSMDGHPD